MEHGKPIIGLAGGIGAGKSFVARLLGELGCCVISSDGLVQQAYQDPAVLHTLKKWWGGLIFDPSGRVDRPAIARKIFHSESDRKRLEQLLHPAVDRVRQRVMKHAADDPNIVAFVWDTPLLFETGINQRCDAVIFVDAPLELRLERVKATRGWSDADLSERENVQMPLDMKRGMSDDVVMNAADADSVRSQVREVLSRILARLITKSQAM